MNYRLLLAQLVPSYKLFDGYTVSLGENITTDPDSKATINQWPVCACGPRLERQIDRLARLPDVVQIAVMPDLHEGKQVPNGVVVATENLIYPELVGSDIGCGMSAIGFRDMAAGLRSTELQQLLRQLPTVIPTLKQPTAVADRTRQPIEEIGQLSCERLNNHAARDGRFQIGTLGRGNHFLELAKASSGQLWAVVHTGSRAMGQHITAHHLSRIDQTALNDQATYSSFDLRQPEGQAYFSDMQWACRYATLSRQTILNAIADLLEGYFGIEVDSSSFIDSPHNIATVQSHQGRTVLVHRKSANIATSARLGLIAGTMLVGTRIVQGLGNPDSLESSAHGAGRVLSRSQAAGSLGARDLTKCMRSIVWHERLAKRLVDESPQAYRDLHEVMAAQRDLVKTIDTLSPILNDKRV